MLTKYGTLRLIPLTSPALPPPRRPISHLFFRQARTMMYYDVLAQKSFSLAPQKISESTSATIWISSKCSQRKFTCPLGKCKYCKWQSPLIRLNNSQASVQGSKLTFSCGSQLATSAKLFVTRSKILVANLFHTYKLHKFAISHVTLHARKASNEEWKQIETTRVTVIMLPMFSGDDDCFHSDLK